jgi:hypothetical protein
VLAIGEVTTHSSLFSSILFSSHSSPFSPLPGVHVRRRVPRHPSLLPWCLQPADRDLGGHLLAVEVDLRGNEERGVDVVDHGRVFNRARRSHWREPPPRELHVVGSTTDVSRALPSPSPPSPELDHGGRIELWWCRIELR